MANCTATNAQYPDMAHCLGSCAAFTVGTSTVNDTTGDTLGCRIYHANASAGATNAPLHCPHAGPGGDLISATTPPTYCSGGDFCTNFCTLEIATCGSTDMPKMINGTAITSPYKNLAACVDVCKNGDGTNHKFDVTHPYATNAAGNSLACRLNHWTNAAANAITDPPTAMSIMAVSTHCGHAAAAPTGPCAGAATP